MNIHAKHGDKVKYVGCSDEQIRFGNCDDPKGILKEGDIYTVAFVEIHSWHSKVHLEGYEDLGFNSVCFNKEGQPMD